MLNGGSGIRKQSHNSWRRNNRQLRFTNFPIQNIFTLIVFVVALDDGVCKISLRPITILSFIVNVWRLVNTGSAFM